MFKISLSIKYMNYSMGSALQGFYTLVFVSENSRHSFASLTSSFSDTSLALLWSNLYMCTVYRCFFVYLYRILHGKCVRTVFTHELWRIRNRTSERSERVRFLIQNNECVNTVQSTFYVVLCLLYTYWDWTPSLNYDKLYLNKCGQTTITERKQLRKKAKELK